MINLQLVATLCLLSNQSGERVLCLNTVRSCVAGLDKAEHEAQDRADRTFTADAKGCIRYSAQQPVVSKNGALTVSTESELTECGHTPGDQIFKHEATPLSHWTYGPMLIQSTSTNEDSKIETCYDRFVKENKL